MRVTGDSGKMMTPGPGVAARIGRKRAISRKFACGNDVRRCGGVLLQLGRMLLLFSIAIHSGYARECQMFERFTDRARRVVVLAQEEARMLNH
ncbi:hypothetical protein, partial [Nocardia sp. JCM 34519.1]|uniref:hypothetical protein n=1 Tax=Nocardia sp. JCM 34519.1 TaxID=2876119 RepID=UPI001CE473B4